MPPTTDCEHCLNRFEAELGLEGALVNCPDCGQATRAAGDGDWLWSGLKILALIAVVAVGILVSTQYGVVIGLGAALAGAALLWLISQAA